MPPDTAERRPRREGGAQDGHGGNVSTSVQRDLDIARHLAAAGIPVFVAYPDPASPTGYRLPGKWQTTTANPAYVGAWEPGRALCAVMGRGLDLVDIDPRNGADPAALDGLMPEVIGVAATPSGGEHRFVQSMGVRSRDGVLPGIDVKAGDPGGEGRGFAFIAPTVRASKATGELVAYRWITPPDLARLNGSGPAGGQLAELVRRAHGSRQRAANGAGFTQPSTWWDDNTGPIPKGERHAKLVSYAGKLRDIGLPLPEAEILMLRRLADCEQPPAAAFPVTREEALSKLRDVYSRYPAGEPVAGDPGTIDDAEPLAWAHLLDWHQAWAGKPDQVEWLIEPLLERGTSNAWFGRPAAGKSLIALEVAAALAAGRPVLGNPAREPMTVLYVDVENAVNDVVERLQAFGYEPDDLGRLIYSSFPDLPALDTFAGGQFLLQAAEAHNPALVMIDTTSRVIAGKENDADTFIQLYRHAVVPLKQRGVTVLRLDHPGKDPDRGQRGSSAKDGDVDTVWLADRVSQTGVNFERHKSRNNHGAAALYLTRKFEPLRHEPGGTGVPPRAADILGALERLQAPERITNKEAQKLLREGGERFRNDDIALALRIRRERRGMTFLIETPGTAGNAGTEGPGQTFPVPPARSAGTGNSPFPEQCAVCGDPLDPALTAGGYTTHPACDPDEAP